MFSLSNEFNIPMNRIMKMNKLKCENVYKNQVIRLPMKESELFRDNSIQVYRYDIHYCGDIDIKGTMIINE